MDDAFLHIRSRYGDTSHSKGCGDGEGRGGEDKQEWMIVDCGLPTVDCGLWIVDYRLEIVDVALPEYRQLQF